MWPPDMYLEKLYKESVENHASHFDDKWKKELEEKFRLALGSFPLFKDSTNPVVLEEVEMEEYYRIRLEITTYSPLKVPTYLLIPKRKHKVKVPAVIALHGHGYGSKEIVGLNPDGSENGGAAGIHKNFAIELVKRGVAVVAPELIGFGERKLMADMQSNSETANSCFSIASKLLLLGKTLAGLRIYECQRILDYLLERDDIDNGNIGCMGFSGGGLVAAYLSVLDKRISAVAISGYANTFKGSIMERNHCLDNYIPGILQHAEMPELIGLIAPRPLFIESGSDDHVFPCKQVQSAYKKIDIIYRAFHAEQSLSSHFFEGTHEISGERSFDWLVARLKN